MKKTDDLSDEMMMMYVDDKKDPQWGACLVPKVPSVPSVFLRFIAGNNTVSGCVRGRIGADTVLNHAINHQKTVVPVVTLGLNKFFMWILDFQDDDDAQ